VSDAPPGETPVIWHDLECGGYRADLALWRQLARQADGAVLDLGAGTGRVALDLAAAGYQVTALDADPVLLDEVARRATKAGLEVPCVLADAQRLSAIGEFALIVAAMQFVQLLGGVAARAELLAGIVSCLAPRGSFAAAIADLHEATAAENSDVLPSRGDGKSWLYSSVPRHVCREAGAITVEWLRRVVSPTGGVTNDRRTEVLELLTPEEFEREAEREGLRAEARYQLSHDEGYIGSTVVVCRREAGRLPE
jgi:SAM-dependent methyltransferase